MIQELSKAKTQKELENLVQEWNQETLVKEFLKCKESPIYFIQNYVRIHDALDGWIPFNLWQSQEKLLKDIHSNRLTIILKARQLGITWIALAYALWLGIFKPTSNILIFSRRDDEAVYILNDRLVKMYNWLPSFLKAKSVIRNSSHILELSNGTVFRAFPTTAGDSYNATLVIVDEADLVPNFNNLFRAVKPTIATGGSMVLLSRPDREKPVSGFKQTFRAALEGENGWYPVFLPWNSDPKRDVNWYNETKSEIFHRTGSLDELFEQYPATIKEALSPIQQNKRIPMEWLEKCYHQVNPNPDIEEEFFKKYQRDTIRGFSFYYRPLESRLYCVGVDPAGGIAFGDYSGIVVLDALTGEEVASFRGRVETYDLAIILDDICNYYNDAAVLFERNNHGLGLIKDLEMFTQCYLVKGLDKKVGWKTTIQSKLLLYKNLTDSLRDEEILFHTPIIYHELASIESETLKAPEGWHDDMAMAICLANQCLLLEPGNVLF